MGLICEGLNEWAIAERLPLSVLNHLASVHSEIGVNRRAPALVWARERCLL